MEHDTLARLLVHQAAVTPGTVVSLLGPTTAEPLLLALFRAVLRAGGQPLLLLRPEACDALLCAEGTDQQLAWIDPLAACEVEAAAVAIHVLLAPARTASADSRRLALLQQARRPLVERFLTRGVRWLATVFPTENVAEIRRAMFLDQPDPAAAWDAQRQLQALLIERLQQAKELRIVTAGGTDLRLGIAGRAWTNGAGAQNMPDGEVYVTPQENETAGTAVFDVPVIQAGREVRGARLTFRAGRVVEATADAGADVLRAILAEPGGAVVGEAALGCNEAITDILGHPLLDEKRAGTFHLALGGPRSPLHCDLIGDLHHDGRIEVDGKIIRAQGQWR